jgi:hypothetical protein
MQERLHSDMHNLTHWGYGYPEPGDSLLASNDSILAVWRIVASSCPSRHDLGTGEHKCRKKNSVPEN